MAIILIICLTIYVLKRRVAKTQSPVLPDALQMSRLKQMKLQYWFGLTLMLLAITYRVSPALFENPVSGLYTRLVYNPSPLTTASAWPWQSEQTIHPAVANIPPEAETSIDVVAQYITQQEPDPFLRVKAIHDYVISRISYDIDVLKTGKRPSQQAHSVFDSHKAVCEGYSRLFAALGRASGLEAIYVRGKVRRDLAPLDVIPKRFRLAKIRYDWTAHAWNAVKIDNSWYLVDTTWDDSAADDSAAAYSTSYLMPPPETMIASHLPKLINWQLLSQPKNQKAFEQTPLLTP
ncbi:MAG: transglutaminase domain-containing protein [Cyanobacteria bacterium P01_G01_bin.38]